VQMRLLSNAKAGFAAARAGRPSLREGLLIRLQVIGVFLFSSIFTFRVIGPVANWFGASQEVEMALVTGFFLLTFVGIVGWMIYLDIKKGYDGQNSELDNK